MTFDASADDGIIGFCLVHQPDLDRGGHLSSRCESFLQTRNRVPPAIDSNSLTCGFGIVGHPVDDRGMARWSAMYGQGHCGEWRFPIPDLQVADELVIAIRPLLATWVPTRIVQSGGKEVVEPRTTDDEEPWTPQVDRRHRPIEPGDLITDVVVFSASDGSGRNSKKRPCLVMEVGDTEIRVRPIHSTGGSLHRTGGGLRILDWRLANLANSSVVSAEDQYRAVDGPVNPDRRIGSLSDRDFERVFGEKRPIRR